MAGKYRSLILLAVIFWQSLAIISSLSLLQHAREGGGAASSGMHAFYQHHSDQTVHQNGEADAASHAHSGAFADVAAMPGGNLQKLSTLPTSMVLGELAIASQSPDLAGPLRPPQILS
jgi:hypothetical protein